MQPTGYGPYQDSTQGQRKRSKLRQALIRWLGGTSAAESMATTPSSSFEQLYGHELVLPKPDPARLASKAAEYFAQAEQLNRCGAPDMASPLYRQAYTLLHGAVAKNLEISPLPQGQQNNSLDLPPNLVEINSVSSQNTIAHEAAQPITQGSDNTLNTAIDSWLRELPALRARLSVESAGEIAARLASLREAGHSHAELHRLEGLTALVLQDTNTAMQRFREALGLNPNHYSSLVNLAGLLLPEGRHEEATALLQRALDQTNSESLEAVPALTNLSLAHQLAGRPMDEALLVLKVHRLKPGHLRNERLLLAANNLEQMGEDSAAIELLSWLQQQQATPEILRALGTLLERRGDYQEAALVYRQLLQPVNPASPVS